MSIKHCWEQSILGQVLLLQLLSDPFQTWQKHLPQIRLMTEKCSIWINRCSDDIINIILAFLTNKYSPWCFSYLLKICCFDTDYEKVCYSWNIYQIESNLWHWIHKCVDLRWWRVLFYWFFEYLFTSSWHHNDFILDLWVQIWDQTVKFSTYAKFQLIMLSIGWDTAMWQKKNE